MPTRDHSARGGGGPGPGPGGVRAHAGLVGRERELTRLRAVLREGRGAVVAGEAGVGKTRIARELAALAADDGFAVERAVATAAAAEIPFGALAAIVPPATGAQDTLPATVRATVDGLRARHRSRRLLLVVDDAHRLDPASALLVHHISAHGHAQVLATVRSGEPVLDPVTALWKDGDAARIDLDPLPEEAIRELATRLAGGPIERHTLTWLLDGARGNPLHLDELLHAALDGGALRREDGVWRRVGPFVPSPRLIEVIDARLGDLTPGERRALALIALAEPLPLATLETLTGLEPVAALERRGLVVDAPDDRGAVRAAHPLHAEVARARLGAVEGRELRAALAQALPRDRPGTRLLRATWALEDGRRDDPALLTAGAADALAGLEPVLAVALGEAALDAGAGLDAIVPLSIALRATARFDEAEKLLAAHEDEIRSTPLRAQYLINRAMGLQWGLGRQDRALMLLQRAQTWAPGADWQATVRQLAATLLVTSGRLAEAAALAEPLLTAPEIEDATRLRLAVVIGHALPLLGRPRDALRLIATARSRCRPGADIEWPVDTAVAFASVPAAEGWAEAEQRLLRRHAEAREAGADERTTYCEMALIRLASVRGEAARVRRLAEDACERLLLMDPREHASTCLADAALASVELGDLDAARGALERYRELQQAWPSSLPSRHRGALAEAALAAAEGDPLAGQRRALAAADETGEALLWEAEALHLHVRLGGPARGVRDRLAALAARTEAPLLELWSRHVTAVAGGDGAELEAVAAAFDAVGACRWAAEASAQAATAHAARGRRGAANRAGTRARRLTASHDTAPRAGMGAGGIATAPVPGGLDELRPREREVATLVALRLSNAEIAERLSLSVRTVESHVYRATVRLGLRSRRELADAVRALVQ